MNEQLKEVLKSIDPESKLITEDVAGKIEEIFNAAVDVKTSERTSEIESKIEEKTETETRNELTEFKESLIDHLDVYLEQATNSILEDIEPSVDNELQMSIYKNIVEGVLGVFKKQNINIPEKDADLIKSLEGKCESLKEEINNLMNENISLKKDILKEKSLRVWIEETNDLPYSQSEKLQKMMEDTEFEDEAGLRKKIKIMKEHFLKSDDGEKLEEEVITEEVDESELVKPSSKKSIVENKLINDLVKKAASIGGSFAW